MKFLLIIIILFTIGQKSFSQNEDDIIVKIGDKSISVEEFKYRYEFTPQVNRKYTDKGKAKEELLYTLIAENLFAAEAEKQGYDTLETMKMNYIPLEKMYVRDALYKQMVSDKVELNITKFNEGLKRANYKLFVDYIYSEDKPNIDDAYNLIKRNPNFDSLVTLIENAEYVSEPYEVSYGKMYFKAEDAIYNLEMNEFTEPIESPEGWYIFRLIGKVPATFQNNDQRNSLVKKVVEDRVEDSIYNDFINDFFADRKIMTDGSIFWYFAEKMQTLIAEIKNSQNIKAGEKITIGPEDFLRLKKSLHPDSLKKDFIKFEQDPVSLESFFNDFVFEGFYTFTTDLKAISGQLNSRIKRQIEIELLAREAYSRGMDNLPDVRNSIEIWKENYLSTLYLKDIVLNTEITDIDINEYLREMKDSTLNEEKVNIIEVLTDSLEIIKEALSLSQDDNRLREFAKIHTKREWTKEKNGEFGFFPVSEYGEIGKIASTMKIGDVYGPLQTNDGYSLFKVIDRKIDSISVNELKITNEVKTQIRYTKIKEYLENLAADLADKYNVSVDNSLLNSLDLMNTQMIVFRFMGFGGRILAFPYSSPFYEWKDKWEQKKKDLL
jgi:parvulin-like peptidyl-prolyl isomerase